MSNVKLHHQGVSDASSRMKTAHDSMIDAVMWLEKNFNDLRETLHGEARTAWDEFHLELSKSKERLELDYKTAKTTLDQMHARQIEGDSNGRRRMQQARG
ncbi:hypothetical protein [Streptomyces sp. H27-D2]|uniref:hypothetical protein n=1 Tax=Streptomyces sp. H27-D2 TaxID=3046304 RepID=UPI002DB726C9|nr:hypothetical protein [Streptomyces sp. H27-D2]MEC4020221.1 hypothetical protein [Streptomyces sp. H27-D2]